VIKFPQVLLVQDPKPAPFLKTSHCWQRGEEEQVSWHTWSRFDESVTAEIYGQKL
jgi:hypothetical protein